MSSCPECVGTVDVIANTEVGEILQCPDCGVELEVRSLQPTLFEMAPQVEEDWGE